MPSCNCSHHGLSRARYAICGLEERHRLRAEFDRVQAHHKTRACSFPALDEPWAKRCSLSALRAAETDAREIFIRTRAPYRKLGNELASAGTGVGSAMPARQAARQEWAAHLPPCPRGRDARASVPQKVIGDLLGHRSTEATAPYLKLATEDLRPSHSTVPGSGVLS